MSSINIQNVTKTYGDLQVLHGIDLEISDEEFVVLVGPSGCGKSTLLRMIAGLEEISGGEIMIDGQLVNHISPQKRDLAMVFQSYALYPHMTVAENMGFSLSLRGAKKAVIEEEVGQAARILHLEEYLDRLPRNLSGGQRQRVAMGRAIVRHPKAFLFDEPLSNLDAKLRTHMRAEIRQIHQTLNATSVYVTHDQIEAMTLADRIVVMNSGNIEQVGTPIELFDRPDTKFVAGFIGAPTMNFFDGDVVTEEDGRMAIRLESAARIGLPEGFRPETGRRLSIGARPQHITARPGAATGDEIAARVELVEQTGCETNLLLRVFDQQISVQTKARMSVSAGDTVAIELQTEYLHIFDQASDQRLN